MSSGDRGQRLSLVGYQLDAMNGLQATIRRVSVYHQEQPENRKLIGRQFGVMLLQAPTGSGKTLILGRALEGLRGATPCKIVWFWFAPYSGLVAQTRSALSSQCGSLRLRDVYTDREAGGARDGDVFIQTWAALAARNSESRKVRRTTERMLSVDDMIASLRADGFQIGVVIDEAHLNFGATAQAAAELYLNVLSPDYTLLATATPRDDKLEQFEKSAGISVENRIVIARSDVVEAGLNKIGLMLGHLKFQSEEDEKLIDIEQATLMAAWNQHGLVKAALNEQGVGVTPLMLVQVEDQIKGGEDPTQRIRKKLEESGVPAKCIRSHTSGEPDPEFHTLAYDPDVEVLIFKVAVATGFDAPRAWTLVSVRPNRGVEFGLQIVGRIMRVHSQVRPLHGQCKILDRGYVFVSDPKQQGGLSAAAEELKAVRQAISLLTDQLDVFEFSNYDNSLSSNVVRDDGFGEQQSGYLPAYQPPKDEMERQARLDLLIEAGIVKPSAREQGDDDRDHAIKTGEWAQGLGKASLFGNLPLQFSPSSIVKGPLPKRGVKRYRLKKELGVPLALYREELPPTREIEEELVKGAAVHFCQDDLLSYLSATRRQAEVSQTDLFNAGTEEHRKINVRLSNARVAEQAQLAFEFNDSIDARILKRALYERLSEMADKKGLDPERFNFDDIRRAVHLAVMAKPNSLKEALKIAQAQHILLKNDHPIPVETDYWPDDLRTAQKGAYGVFPEHMNNEERAFAEFLDGDDSGRVRWWLRTPENTLWAVVLRLPNGKRFFPDFAVGVQGRSSRDAIALVEIKDSGVDGRLQSDNNTVKIRVEHREYRKVLWVYRTPEKKWVRASYAENLGRIIPRDAFNINDLVLIE